MSALLYSLPLAPERISSGLMTSTAGLRARLERRNDVIPIIIVIAIIVLLALAVTIVAAAVILCAQRGGVLDTVVNLDAWTVKVKCHKI